MIFRKLLLSGIAIVFSLSPLHFHRTNEDVEIIKSLMQNSYLNGAFNEMNTDAMKQGFHPDFAYLYMENGQMKEMPLAQWIENVKKRKGTPAQKDIWTSEIKDINIEGESASVKIILFKNGEKFFTDYLHLYKFGENWKVVGKIFHRHQN